MAEASTADEERVYYHVTDGSGALQVHVKNGRIIRVRPAQFAEADLSKPWTLNIGGKVFRPPKPSVSPFALASRRRVYSPLRILYPMKRVDFDPNGDRHPENRGKSEYVRITWDEALTLTANELKRIKQTYGPSGLYFQYPSHWQHGGELHDDHYTETNRVLCLGLGGYTSQLPNMDSWEGWYYGATMTWGFLWFGGKPFGGMPPHWDMLQDTLENSKMVVMWSHDVFATELAFDSGQDWATYLKWVKERGIQIVFITPDVNYTCGVIADKWIPIRAGTDSALALAIAYVWLSEGLYDKNYLDTHTYGFDAWKDYVVGVEDGVPKTPEWAESITGVKAAVTRALAREWGSKPTALSTSFGGACRAPFGSEWARMMLCLQAMQGLGKPGVNMWDGAGGTPTNFGFTGLPTSEGIGAPNIVAKNKAVNSVPQMIWRVMFADAVLNPPITWYGLGLPSLRQGKLPPMVPAGTDWYEAHFHMPWTYPLPGQSEIHAIFKEGSSQIANWVGTSKYIRAYQSPKIEFIVLVDFWWGSEARFADVILPGTTTFERNDISGWITGSSAYNWTIYCQQCIEPLGESKSELDIELGLAEKLGVLDQYREDNMTEDDWIRKFWNMTAVKNYMTYEEWKAKGYFIYPFPDNYQPIYPMRQFYEATDLTKIMFPLETPTKKIEFESQRLKSWWPTDPERPPVPHYIPPPEVADSSLAAKYPLIVMAPHPKFRMHTMYDDVSWLKEIPTHKLKGSDGYYYECMWMNPKDAQARGIKHGDIIKAWNDRGAVLFAAYVSERIVPGYVRACQDARYDPVDPTKSLYLDRGGAINLLTSDRPLSQHASGMAPNFFRVEVARWEGQ